MKTKSLTLNGSASVPTLTSTTSPKHEPNDGAAGPVVAETTPAPGSEPAPDQIVPVKDETVGFWVSRISLAVGNSAGWTIQAGQELIRAKKALGHGHWMEMFGPGGLRFSVRSAEVLMCIGAHPYFVNSQHLANLPPSYTALYALSHVDEQVIERGVKEGVISPGMRISEARRFVAANQEPAATPSEPPAFDPEKHLGRIKRFVLKELEDWPGEHRASLADLLESMAKEVQSNNPLDDQPTGGNI